MRTLVIIPAFNEEKNLPSLLERLSTEFKEYDYVIINDASRDDTRAVARSFGFDVLDLPINLGIGGAVQTGLKYAYYNGYDIAVQLDGDGQHNPGDINRLINEIMQGYNVCIGSRFIDNEGFQSTFLRRIGIYFYHLLIRFFTKQVCTDPTSGFRAFDREAIKYFVEYYPIDYPEPEAVVLLSKNAFKVKEIPVVMHERCGGESSITFNKSFYFMIKVTIAIFAASLIKHEREDLNG